MTHQDGTDSLWECCGAWECVCGVPNLLQALKDSLVRRCSDCSEPVDAGGVTHSECGGGSGEKCDTCFGCTCDGSCW